MEESCGRGVVDREVPFGQEIGHKWCCYACKPAQSYREEGNRIFTSCLTGKGKGESAIVE